MHLCFPHPSCLPCHGSPCSSADQPHGVSRACVRVGSFGKTGIHKCGLHLSSSLWLGSKALSTCSWRGKSGLPTGLLLVCIALQPSKGVSLSCVRPRTCVSNIGLEPLTPRAYLQPCNLPYILSALPWAHVRTGIIIFPLYPVPCGSFFQNKFGNLSVFSN